MLPGAAAVGSIAGSGMLPGAAVVGSIPGSRMLHIAGLGDAPRKKKNLVGGARKICARGD